MNCRVCEADTEDSGLSGICASCWYFLKQYHKDFALIDYVNMHLPQLQKWMKENMREEFCMQCKYVSYWMEGSECLRENNPCPQGYETKPDSTTVKIDSLDDSIARYQYTILKLKKKLNSVKQGSSRQRREIKRLRKRLKESNGDIKESA